MKQMTLAGAKGFEKHSRSTRKAAFLARMEVLMPWAAFCALIDPYSPKAGNGRPPVGLERMLRMYFIANWFNLADEACEDALYDISAFREFCRIDLGRERVPDATTLMNFRHLLEQHKLVALKLSGRSLRLPSPKKTILIGLVQTGAFLIFQTWALVEGGAGKTAVLIFTMPIWTLFLAWPILGERIRGGQWWATASTLVGLVLIIAPWDSHRGRVPDAA